jgi:hypothetical protein
MLAYDTRGATKSNGITLENDFYNPPLLRCSTRITNFPNNPHLHFASPCMITVGSFVAIVVYSQVSCAFGKVI